MGEKGLLTDDYVADLLAKEAKDCSLKYSTMGMEAYTSTPSSSRPPNMAKPNTRFLRNIIKGTEHHNKTLLAKEHAEAQARLREHTTAEEEKRRKYRPSAEEMRDRQLGRIAALVGGQPGQKRKRAATEEEVSDLQKARAAEDARRLANMAAARQRQRGKDGRRKRSLERYSARWGAEGEERKERSRRSNTSSGDEDRGEEDRRRRHRSRSPETSPRQHRHRSPLRDKKNGKSKEERPERSQHRRSEAERKSSRQTRDAEEDADSDPLEDLIGPAPPPRVLPRGRGALRGSSGMDSRFSSDYDPKSDMQVDKEGHDDWDEALEALRARARFKQQGADRLREAGFTEDQVKKWEKGDEKTIEDVKWTKAGEKREWDRGKDAGQEDSD